MTFPGQALLQPSGSTVSVTPAANAAGPGGTRVLAAPGDIFQGDVITTGSEGEAQILFRDDSRFVVGPNSQVTIDEFVFSPDGTAQDVALTSLKGTFRFIGGASRSDAYSIRTPTMTIGIRGTALDWAVANLETTVLWQEGSGRLCVVPEQAPPGTTAATECIDVATGDMAVAAPGGGFADVSAADRALRIDRLLPYAELQTGLLPGFQIARPAPAPAPSVTTTPGSYP
jgi:hypothetical protein